MKRVTVLGAGHWGLALADVLANNKNEILIYGRDKEDMNNITLLHQSKYFKGRLIHENIKATSDIEEAINFSDIILISLPVTAIMDNVGPFLNKYQHKSYVFTSKGLYKNQSMSKNFLDANPNLKLAVLSGPSFSNEVMDHKYTCVTIASKDLELAKTLQQLFNNSYFRVYTSEDIVGVEYLGAIKNVFAIVSGMIDGYNMGSNTKNAVITRCLSEMERVMKFVGGNNKTLYGLAGIGDIMLTCNSFESRNYSYGYNYVRGSSFDKSQGIVEGLNTVKELHQIALDNNLELPVVNSVYSILCEGSTIEVEAAKLMNRELKSEW